MRVLFLSHLYPSADRPAYGMFVHEQARALIKQGVNVKVLAPTRRRLSDLNAGRWQDISVIRPRYFLFPRNFLFHYAGPLMYRGIRRAVHNLRRAFPFELIHAHNALPEGYAALILRREIDVPVVVTIHGRDLQDTINRGRRCFAALNLVFAGADEIITVSNKLKTLAAEHLHLNDTFHISTIYNGFDLSHTVKSPPDELLQRYRGKQLILSVSNLYHTKGVDLNLRALFRIASRYPHLMYLIIGGGPERQQLESIARRLNISDRVEFLGPQTYPTVMQYMSRCDFFSLPSWREGFGVVYLEAAAHGRPIIACRGEGIAEVFQHNREAMLIEPRRVDDLARALAYLLDHPDEARLMGVRARQKVQEKFCWDHNARIVKDLYERVLYGRVHRPG